MPLTLALLGVSAPEVAAAGTPGAVVAAAPGAGGAGCGQGGARGVRPAKSAGSAKPVRSAKPAKKAAGSGCVVRGAVAGPRGERGLRGPRGPKGERGLAGTSEPCTDVDTVRGPGNYEFTAALRGGRVFLGHRTVTPTPGVYSWKDLTTRLNPGFPRSACGVALIREISTVRVKVLTTGGDLYETFCTHPATGPVVWTCPAGWTPLVRP
ncbi:hypothetical protein AMK16_31400 [Streptomyces sp. CB00455]|nr:hypothetical protein AMK16_31400 [Streptomyces sp. CB00455]